MNALYPKILEYELGSFLKSLAPDTIIQMWVELCSINNYSTSNFNWFDFETMVSNNPTAVGLEIVTDYDYDNYRDGYPYSENEMDDKILEYLNN